MIDAGMSHSSSAGGSHKGRAGCVVVTGPPGAGKSTVARAIAHRLPRAALVNGDFISQLVVSGRVWALGEPRDEAARQVRLCNANVCTLALNFAAADITPIIDWVIPDREQYQFYGQALASLDVVVVVLAPDADVCRARNEERPAEEQFFFDGHAELAQAMWDAYGEDAMWIDSSRLTVDQTVDMILERTGLAR